MKKVLKITGICCLTIIIIIGIYMCIPSKTLDFRGTVTEIEQNDNYVIFTVEQAEIAKYKVTADKKTQVSYCHNDDGNITLEEIIVGDCIEGNYRWLSKDKLAKFITVEYHN